MAAYTELYIDQGTTFTSYINLTDDVTNVNANILGYIIRSQMRRSYYSANSSANLVCTITDAANGAIELSLSAANTANLKPGKYLFDVEVMDRSDITTRILEGVITVAPEITRG